ncbi:GTPase-activating protein-like [Xenia sp. Carnegie-2017]|uniref:GTPase-activating protein-like n=1 Tax=Xenia sp. Carnegie-2017 TaxID=2897299 RepID=UPI001F04EE46|nr:GTPase-activating protein-like [Xenia sp. Carnegie-2017]
MADDLARRPSFSQHDKIEKIRSQLQDLKAEISQQSKRNFELDRDVRFFDKRIALLINHRISVEELSDRIDQGCKRVGVIKDELERQIYGQLFYLLQTEPFYVAQLTRSVSMNEIDDLLETVMFSLYGQQYEEREEHLLLCMFELSLKYEFDEAEGFNGVLRANTAISRMMSSYTRRGPGQEYLKETLEDPIREICGDLDLDLEINPMKVYARLYDLDNEDIAAVSPEQVQDDKRVQETVVIRLQKLKSLAQKFVDIMESSVDRVPFGIRWICYTVRKLAMEKFPDLCEQSEDANDKFNDKICSLIGGFFLLRFINPAIVSPHVYMLMSKQPNSVTRRNLLLIAKIIQHTANVTPGKTRFKEDYMQPLSVFVEKHKKRLCNFLNNLCSVPPFYSSLEMELYIGLSKKTEINITLNQIYHFHGLIMKYKRDLNLTEDDPLNTILSDMGPPKPQLSYLEDISITLSLNSRWEQVPVVRFESLNSTLARNNGNGVQRSQWKQLLSELFCMRPKLLLEPTLTMALAAAVNLADSEAAVSALSEFLLQKYENVRQTGAAFLEEEEFYMDVKMEVDSRLHQFDELNNQLESLKRVHKTICDHRNFLVKQLDAYKEYLHVVRQRAASKDGGLVQGHRHKSPHDVKYSFTQLEKEGIIIESHNIPEKRKSSLYFTIKSPSRGIYKVSLLSKDIPGVGIAQTELQLEELLELQYLRHPVLNLNESVLLDVRRTLVLLQKHFNTS